MSLTPKEQRAILDGDYPSLIGLERFEVGQTLEVTSRVSVRIEKRNLRKGKVQWDYTVVDHRDRVLRFRPPARGKQVQAEDLSATEITKASEQSAYDGNPRDPMDAGVCVPAEVQNVFSQTARARWAMHQRDEHSEQETQRDLQRVNAELRELVKRAVKMGIAPTEVIAPVAREIDAQHRGLKKAA